MKYLILVGDGMGDYPLAELDGKTPLETASTPEMDALCRKGELFLTHTVPDGYSPGSDVANLSLIGYDPVRYYTGRAPLEAASMGISLASDETAFRCNLVTLKKRSEVDIEMVDFSAGHITTTEAAELIETLNNECDRTRYTFYPGVSYRHLLIVKGQLEDMEVVPPHDYIEKDVSSFFSAYFEEANWAALMQLAEEVLADHPVNLKRMEKGLLPANSIWPWGEGKMPTMPTLSSRFDISGSMISAVDLLKGIGVNAGLNVINVPGATGFIDTNYAGKAKAALNALEKEDFVFVHVEAPDECGHQGSIPNKIKAIEDFDAKIVGTIINGLRQRGESFRAVVTMDHFTPIAMRSHTTDPVPTLLYDSTEANSGSNLTFCEKSTNNNSGLEILQNGHELINKLLLRPYS